MAWFVSFHRYTAPTGNEMSHHMLGQIILQTTHPILWATKEDQAHPGQITAVQFFAEIPELLSLNQDVADNIEVRS